MIKRPTYDDYDEYIIDYETTNASFIAMASLLRRKGIKNYNFFLKLYDEDLVGVDPFDPDLSAKMKMKIVMECRRNFWYFIREVMIIPGVGRYQLNRGNLALSWCCLNNIPTYQIMPRQHGKTWGVVAYALWVFNFASDYTEMLFLNKQLGDAQTNLDRLRQARGELPDYLRMDKVAAPTGTMKDAQSNVNSMKNAFHNKISVKASARNPISADELGRGLTVAWVWIDEFAFLQFNDIIYAAMAPAYKKAAEVAIAKGKPVGKILTTTPSDLSTAHGAFAYDIIQNSARFDEKLYDWDSDDVNTWINKNSKYGYVYIEYSYVQLGHKHPDKWFEEACQNMLYNWPKIRREILLQWSNATSNSPFDEDDLRSLHAIQVDPSDSSSITINKFYKLNVYTKLQPDKKYIISIDPAKGKGLKADRTAVVVIDAETDECCAIFKSSVIQYRETFRFLYTLFNNYIPLSTIVIENNIDTLIEYVKNSTMKHALYYEPVHSITKDKKNKPIHAKNNDNIVYGITTTSENRPKYFDILYGMVREEKDKIKAKELVEEIETLEYRSETRIEAVSGMHDDVVLAYLMGVYVKRYGHNRARFGLFYSEGINKDTKPIAPEFFTANEPKKSHSESELSPFWAELLNDTNEAIERSKNSSPANTRMEDYYDRKITPLSKEEKVDVTTDIFSKKNSNEYMTTLDGDAFEKLNARGFSKSNNDLFGDISTVDISDDSDAGGWF